MPNANEVTPKKWKDISILYDDGTFSVIIGHYDNHSKLTMACRWNGQEDNGQENVDVGYPKLFNKPVWFNLPKSFMQGILLTVRGELVKALSRGTITEQEFNGFVRNQRQAELDIKAGR